MSFLGVPLAQILTDLFHCRRLWVKVKPSTLLYCWWECGISSYVWIPQPPYGNIFFRVQELILSYFGFPRFLKPAPMFLDDSFRKWARIRDFVPPFGIKGQGMRKLYSCWKRRSFCRCLPHLIFLVRKLRWCLGLSFFPCSSETYVALKLKRVFRAGRWTSEACLREGGLAHGES